MKPPVPSPSATARQREVQQRFYESQKRARGNAGHDRKPALYWYCRTPRGWRYFRAISADRPGVVIDKGVETTYSQGRFAIRQRMSDGNRVYLEVNGDPTVALQAVRQRSADSQRAQRVLKDSTTFTDDVNKYVNDLKRAKCFDAAENATLVLAEFMAVCPTVRRAKGITREHVLTFVEALELPGSLRKGVDREEGNSPRTVSGKFNRIRSFLKFHGCDTKPLAKLLKKPAEKPITTYTTAETDEMLAACGRKDSVDGRASYNGDYMRVAITMLLRLGLRERELTNAEWSDIEGRVFVVQSKPERGFIVKKDKTRRITMRSDVTALLDKWRAMRPGTKLIIGIGTAPEYDTVNGHLLRWVQALAKRAGVTAGGEVNLHKFRRTFLTALSGANTFDVPTLMQVAGHDDYASLKRYLDHAKADSPEMLAKMDAVEF